MEKYYWPFPTDQANRKSIALQCEIVEWMQVAFAEGFSPCVENGSAFVLGEASKARSAALVNRGPRNGYEPWLTDGEQIVRLASVYTSPNGENACICVRPPFRAAAYLAIEWMRGRSIDSLLADFEFVGGRPEGIVLRREVNWATFRVADID